MRKSRIGRVLVGLGSGLALAACAQGGGAGAPAAGFKSQTSSVRGGSISTVQSAQAQMQQPLKEYLAESGERDPQAYLLDVQMRYEKLRGVYSPWASSMQAAPFPSAPSDGLPSRTTALKYQAAFGSWLDSKGALIRDMANCMTRQSTACISRALANSPRHERKEQMLAAGRAFDSEAGGARRGGESR